MHSGDPEVQEVILSFAQLQISLRVEVRGHQVTAAAAPAATDLGEGSELTSFVITDRLVQAAVAAQTPAERAALDLGFLDFLVRRLTASDSHWTARARIGRAFRAGVVAHNLLAGGSPEAPSPSIPFRNTIYVILRSPSLPGGGWTTDYRRFIGQCGGNSTRDFDDSTVCHSFPTRSEAQAYLAGARRGWPPHLQ